MATPKTIIIGNRRTTHGKGMTRLQAGEIIQYVPNKIPANCWIHTAKVWMGRAGSITGTARPVGYNAQGVDGKIGPVYIHSVFDPISPSKRMADVDEGAIYSSTLWNGQKGKKGRGGDWISIGLHGLIADTNVGRTLASEISGDNERLYHRYNYDADTPPNPMGFSSTETGFGWLVMWFEGDENLAPLAPTSVGPTGNIGSLTPTIVATFVDPNGANGGGVDRGDVLSATLVQVRRKVDQVAFWNVEYAATDAEKIANQSSIVYGSVGTATPLVRGITYQARVAHKDDFGAVGPFSSWVDFTPADQGMVTIGANPVAGKVDALQPSIDIAWNHQTGLATNAVRVEFWKGRAKVKDSGTVSRTIASAGTDTLTWAILGLTGNLEDGVEYTALVYGRDTAGIWSGASAARVFTTDKAPGIPVILSPTGNLPLPNSSYPKIVAKVVDPDNNPATELIVKVEILTQAGSLISTRIMSLVSGTTDTFDYQTTAADLPAVGDFKARAYAGDGYLWSGVQTVEASAVRSVEALFQWKAVPAVTLTAPVTSSTLNDDTPDLIWSVATQEKFRVRALDAISGVERYTSGEITSAALRAWSLPIGWVRNGALLNFEIGVYAGGLWGYAVATNVLIGYTPPPTLANFTVLPETIGDDPFPTSARISFDPYLGTQFAGYLIERSDLSRPLIIGMTVDETAFSDMHVPSQPVTFTGRVIEARGIDEYVMSDPVSVTFSLDMHGVAIVSLAQPMTQRFVTLQRGKRNWKLKGEESSFLPRGADAPLAKTGRARWREGSLEFKLRTELGDTEADRLALEAIAESGTGFSYRDRHRREFMRIPVDGGLEIEDLANGAYDVAAQVRRVLHVEGVS